MTNDKYFAFLDSVREGGTINMFGAGPCLQDMFGMGKTESRKVLKEWMETYEERHNRMKWGIWATVSGGVTGHRESWCRINLENQTFDTREEADAQADRYRRMMAKSVSPAVFYYEVRKYV